jgi:hypothetical protein
MQMVDEALEMVAKHVSNWWYTHDILVLYLSHFHSSISPMVPVNHLLTEMPFIHLIHYPASIRTDVNATIDIDTTFATAMNVCDNDDAANNAHDNANNDAFASFYNDIISDANRKQIANHLNAAIM